MVESSDNYQLKWHSYSTHLHSCVASSLTSEVFADVSLCTTDGHYIMAHRFVLSACSQYLNQVLKFQQKITTTLPLVIILPPEINYKTIKTLINYMYSGETTVSKDILENVLRGGDILKVKGLWRPKEDRPNEKRLAKVQEQHNAKVASGSVTPTISESSQSTVNANKKETTIPENVQRSPNGVKRSELSNQTIVTDTNSNQAQIAEDHSSKEDSIEKISSLTSALEESSSLQYLVIKDEPIEWSELEEEEMDILENTEMFNTEMDIKPEVIMNETEDKAEELYSPLTCELCSETFTLPAEWVRHIQTHTDMLPAKRQRRGRSTDEESGTFPPLHCDMCQKFYATPAEWVRHIQNAHTEFELRVSNKTMPTKPLRVYRKVDSTHKMCTMCNKKFPSHASMLIHKRTHTGEKPYMCEHCQKGFNVKSNLLRHLRTLHDKIINPTDVEYKDDGKSSSNSNSDF